MNSGWRNPRRNRAVPRSHVNSNHQRAKAVDMEPAAGTPAGAARRRSLLDIYNAALAVGGNEVLLEHGGLLLWPRNRVFPAPIPDRDGDGLPDNPVANPFNVAAMNAVQLARLHPMMRVAGNVTFRALFNAASHVHGSF